MRIAFVTSDLSLPPKEGIHQQTTLLIDAIRAAGHVVDVFGFSRQPVQVFSFYHDRPLPLKVPTIIQGLINMLAPSYSGVHVNKLLKILKDSDYDVIHLEGAAAAGCARRELKKRTLVSLIDPPSLRRQRLIRVEGRSTKLFQKFFMLITLYFERLLMERASVIHVVSQCDAQYLKEVYSGSWANIISIPVMLPKFDFSPEKQRVLRQILATGNIKVLIFADLRLRYMQGALMEILQNAIPKIRSQVEGVDICVLGRVKPPANIAAEAERNEVEILAWADDYQKLILESHIMIIPDTFGTGIKNRLVQGLAAGCVVVGTPVAVEGIDVKAGCEMEVYTSMDELVEVAVSLIGDDRRRQSLSDAAISFACINFSAANVCGRWINTYRAIADGTGRRDLDAFDGHA